MTEPAPVRIALAGCGRISRNHFDAIAKVDGLELAAVCDIVPERASAAALRFGVPAFESVDDMLASATCDAVALCTPSGLHPTHGILAARAGKHVICEKPMAITLEDADALVRECDAAGVQLFVVKQNRLNPAIQLLKRAVEIGKWPDGKPLTAEQRQLCMEAMIVYEHKNLPPEEHTGYIPPKPGGACATDEPEAETPLKWR